MKKIISILLAVVLFVGCTSLAFAEDDNTITGTLNLVSFNVDGMTSNELATELSRRGFALRGGLHCSGLAHRSAGTLPEGGVRFSPSVFNTAAQTDMLADAVKKLAHST